jgi:hypothetical protein
MEYFYYDEFGYLTTEENEIRKTDVSPLGNLEPGNEWNWSGTYWFQTKKIEKQIDDTVFSLSDVLPGIKKNTIQKIRKHFDNVILSVKADSAKYEPETWEVQRIEYTSWLNNPATATPYLDTLAIVRGITKDEMMAKVGRKIMSFATLQGTQQALEKAVNSATTLEELNVIELPDGI